MADGSNFSQALWNMLRGSSFSPGQSAYDNARKAGASTGRARRMAEQADLTAGIEPETGFGYDINSANMPSWMQSILASRGEKAPARTETVDEQSQWGNVQVPQIVSPSTSRSASNDNEEKKLSERTESNEAKKKNDKNRSPFQAMLESVMSNPETQSIMQGSTNPLGVQQAEAAEPTDNAEGEQGENNDDEDKTISTGGKIGEEKTGGIGKELDENDKPKGYSHDFDVVRDLGGFVPLVGPAISAAGGFGNALTSDLAYELPKATSRPQEVVKSGEYIASPESLAFPTVQDVQSSLTDEDYEAWLENTAMPLDTFIAEAVTAPLGGMGGTVASALSKSGQKALKELPEGVALDFARKYYDATIDQTVKNALGEGEDVIRNLVKEGKKPDANDFKFVDAYVNSLPQDVQNVVRQSMATASPVPAGIPMTATNASRELQVAQSVSDEMSKLKNREKAFQQAKNDDDAQRLLGSFVGGTTPRLGRAAAFETTGGLTGTNSVGVGQELKDSKDTKDTKDTGTTIPEDIFGMSPEDWGNLEQREQYVRALQDDALKNYYKDTYGADLIGDLGYEYFRDLGENDISTKEGLVRDLFGYNRDDEGNSQYAIPGWQDLAANSISGLSDMSDDEAVQAILDYMWGAGNIINPYEWMFDASYQAAHDMGDQRAVYNMGKYLAENYTDTGNSDNFIGNIMSLGENPEAIYPYLNDDDLATWVLVGDIMNKGMSDWDQEDWDTFNELTEASGEGQLFGVVEPNDNKDWNKTDWKKSNRDYSFQSLLNALRDTAQNPNNPQLDIYNGVGNVDNPLISQQMMEDFASMAAEQTGKKIGRRVRD